MVPLHDDNPTRITPVVVYALIAINVVVFFYEMNLGQTQSNSFFQLYAVVPRELTQSFGGVSVNQPVPEPFTLITSQFLHGSLLHIGFNMLFLWIFGNNVEEALGHVKFLIFYLACGVLAALTHWFFSMPSPVPTVGASGAIAGVMGAYILKFPNARILTLVPLGFFITAFRIPAVFFLGFWFVQQALNGILSVGMSTNVNTGSGGVAYWAHAGGFVFGALLGPLLGLFSDRVRR